MGKFKKFSGICILALCLVCLSLGLNFVQPTSSAVALGSTWTYDPEAQTLTYYDSRVLENVTASGYDLTIGNTEDYIYPDLDLSGGVEADAEGNQYVIKTIANDAFKNNGSIGELLLPDTLSSIGNNAFSGCTSLYSVRLYSKTPPTLGSGAFSNSGITEIIVPYGTDGAYKSAAGWSEFADVITVIDGDWVFDKDAGTLKKKDNSVTLNNVTLDVDYLTIGVNAGFTGALDLSGSVTDGYSISAIGANAFADSGLTSIVLPDTVEGILQYAFKNCAIGSIELPQSCMTILEGAFYGTNIKSLTLPSYCMMFEGAFKGCAQLETLTVNTSMFYLPVSLTADDFEGCNSLKTITLTNASAANIRIESGALDGLTSLENINVRQSNLDGFLADANWGAYADKFSMIVEGWEYDPALNVLKNNSTGTVIQNVTASGDLLTIGNGGGSDVSGKLDLNAEIFDSDVNEYKLSVIENNAFSGSGLTEIYLPSTLTEIKSNAFANCASLTTVRLFGTDAPVLGSGAFGGCSALNKITVPSSSEASYQAAGWGSYSSITEYKDGYWTYEASSQTLTRYDGTVVSNVTAEGKLLTIGENAGSVFPSVLDLSGGIDDGYEIIAIGQYAFGETMISSVIIPEGVTSIGDMAFVGTGLSYISLPESLQTIGAMAFQMCMSLTEIVIPENVTKIYDGALIYTGIKALTIPENADFGNSVFTYCSSLETLEIRSEPTETLTLTAAVDFNEVTALKSITITKAPASKLMLETGALDGCISLETIYVSESLADGYRSADGWSAYSDKIVGIPDPVSAYTLTVNGGTGGGEYSVGDSVTVTANAPETGKHFAGWSGADGLVFTQGSASTATIVFKMPANAVTLTATYDDHTVEIIPAVPATCQSTGLTEGQKCSICGEILVEQQVIPVGDHTDGNGDGYCDVCGTDLNQSYLLTLIDGQDESVSQYHEGDVVTITASGADGKHFAGWVGAEGLEFTQGSVSTATIVFNMPSNSVTLTATYANHSGTDDGDCTTAVICEVCGEVITPAQSAHNWGAWTSNGDGTHSRYCQNDGCTKSESGDCVDNNSDGYCDICGGAMNVQQGEKWTYNASAQTLTSPDGKTLNNVTAAGTNLTIGSNTGFSGVLDLSAGVDGYTMVAIGEEAFLQSNITSAILPEGLTTIGGMAFATCYELAYVDLPDSLETISFGGFFCCYALEQIELPEDLKEIGMAAFSASGLKTLTIPENATFGEGAFNQTQYLESVIINTVFTEPRTFTSNDFLDCLALKSITITNAPASMMLLTGGDLLDGAAELTDIYVPYERVQEYKSAQGWSDHADKIKAIPGTEPSVVTVTVNGGTGGGEYSVGDPVTVTANAPETGKHFAGWVGADGLTFLDGTSSADATAKFSMPARSVTLIATYANHSGTDDGDCTTAVICDVCGEVIIPAQDAHNYGAWASNNDGTHSRSCLNEGCTVSEKDDCVDGDSNGYCDVCGYDMRERFALTVSGGTGSGNYLQGDPVTATATGESGKHFVRWDGTDGLTFIDDTTAESETVKFAMPAYSVTLTAVYENHVYSDDGDCTTAVVCDVCGEVIIPAQSAHSYGDWISNGDGTHRHSCTNEGCNHTETDYCSGGAATCTDKTVCEVCGGEYGELAPHDYSVIGCDGESHWHKCSVCGDIEAGSTEAHYGGTATCTQEAVCDVCGTPYGELADHVDGDGNGFCDECNFDMREKYTLTVTGGTGSGEYLQGDPATATATGESGKHFVRWDGTDGLAFLDGTTAESETVKFTMPTYAVTLTAVYEAHTGTDDGDCTTEVVCDKCGEVITPAQSAHSYGDWISNGNGTHSHSCTNAGCNHTETDNCHGGTATCTEHAVCEVCGGEYGELAEHDYSVIGCDGESHWHKCSVCGDIEAGSTEAHYGGTATCTEQTVCDVCGTPYGEYAEHDYVLKSNATEHWEECSVCGVEKAGSRAAHSGGTATCEHKAVCEICDREYGELAEHTEEILPYRAPTCTTPGLTEGKKCSVCGKIIVAQTEIPVIDHVDKDGNGKCDVCGTDMAKEEYVVTVTGATGGGRYEPGATVTLTATVPEGKHFSNWVGTDGLTLLEETTAGSKTIKFTMPSQNVELTAISEDHVYSDDGDCTTAVICTVCREVVKPAEKAHNFGAWESNGDGTHSRYCQNDDCEQHEDGNCSGGTATCTDKAVCSVCGGAYGELADHVDANDDGVCDECGTVLSAVVTVNGGTGGARYDVGSTVTVTADDPDTGKHFAGWNGADGLTLLEDTTAGSKTIKFTMPAYSVTLTAVYENHVYSDDGDCTTAVVCDVCREVITPAQSAHSYGAWTSNGDGTHSHSCTNAGCNHSETDDCSGGTATCTDKAVCEVCGEEYGDTLPHEYVTKHNATEHWEECSVCGVEKAGSREAHSGGTATCQHKAECEVCGAEYGSLTAHSPLTVQGIPATCTTPGLSDGEKCGVCGEVLKPQTVIPALGHADNDNNGICDRCGQSIVTVKVENGAIVGESGTTAVVNKDGSVTVTANAAPQGKVFKGWSIDGGNTIISENASYTFTASGNMTLTAVYGDSAITPGDNNEGGTDTPGNTGGNNGGSGGGDLGGLSGTAVIIILICCILVAGVGGFTLCTVLLRRRNRD